jgi:protein TonB
MTGVYNRPSKRHNLIVPLVIALAIHVFIFNIPVKEKVASGFCKAISVCIVPSNEPAAFPLPAHQAAGSLLKSSVKPKPVAPPEPTVSVTAPSPRKTAIQPLPDKKAKTVESHANIPEYDNPEAYAEPEPETVDEAVFAAASLESGTFKPDTDVGDSIETAAVGKNVAPGAAETEARSGKEGEGVITFAMPRYKDNPPPRYPRMAKRRGYEGRTVLEVEVFENGRVGNVVIAETSGFEVLDRAALKSVKKWIFVPGTENGKRVRQQVMVPVRFDLN